MSRIMLVLMGLSLCPWWALGQGHLTVAPATQLVADGTVEWVIFNSDLTQNGTLVPGNSVLAFRGDINNNPAQLGGNGTISFYDLEIDLSNSSLVLGADVSVRHFLTLVQGDLDLNGQTVDLLATGSLQNETDAHRVRDNAGGGTLLSTQVLNSPSQVSPGNLGATISSGANLGNTLVIRGHQIQPLVAANGIERYYDITPATNTGLSATLRFAYLPSELNGVNEGNLLLYRSTDGGISYTAQGASTVNPSDDWIELVGLNAFSRWTTGEGIAFSVEWLGLDARWLHEGVDAPALISWETAVEQGSDYFVIERKASEAGNWSAIGQVAAHQAGAYALQDASVSTQKAADGSWYYRIVEVDHDGRQQYSNTVVLQERAAAEWMRVSPNPARDRIRLQARLADQNEARQLVLMDLQGRRIWQQALVASGPLDLGLNLPPLPRGIYVLELTTTLQRHRIRLQISD